MRKTKIVTALAVSVVLAFLAARTVYRQLNRPALQPVMAVQSTSPAPAPVETDPALTPGMRMFSVQVDPRDGSDTALKRGDRVDIIATTDMPENETGSVSRMVLQNIRIHRIDTASGSSKKLSTVAAVTAVLEVTPEQALLLASASATSDIALLHRGDGDEENGDVSPAAFTLDGGPELLPEAADIQAGALPSGMRAITIPVRNVDGITGLLKKNDRVDILATSPYSRVATNDVSPGNEGVVTEYRMASRVILQNVEVLSTEQDAALTAGLPEPAGLVTLLVTPDQAEILTVASDATSKSTLRLILRNRGDSGLVTSEGKLLVDVLMPRAERWDHEVTVFRGTEKSMQYLR